MGIDAEVLERAGAWWLSFAPSSMSTSGTRELPQDIGVMQVASEKPDEPATGHADRVWQKSERLGLDERLLLDWPSERRAAIFDVDLPREQTRQLRVSAPPGMAWALFERNADTGRRGLASAKAVGYGGTSHVKLRMGTWALALFKESGDTSTGEVQVSFEDEDVKSLPTFLADAHELRRLVLGTLVLSAVLSLGEAGRVYLLTGNVWTSWVAWPIGVMFLLFPVSFAISTVYHCFHSMPILRGEQKFRSPTFANRPIKVEGMVWPSVTIQIPVFREPFNEVIRPTLESARTAAQRYRDQTGARCNVLVCDDGLLCFANNDLDRVLEEALGTPPEARSMPQAEVVARTQYYAETGVAFVARPWPTAGRPGTERAGRFRKASNLNYALRLADRLEAS